MLPDFVVVVEKDRFFFNDSAKEILAGSQRARVLFSWRPGEGVYDSTHPHGRGVGLDELLGVTFDPEAIQGNTFVQVFHGQVVVLLHKDPTSGTVITQRVFSKDL